MDQGSRPVRFGDFQLDSSRRRLTNGRGEVWLGSRSMDLLIALVERAGRLLSHRDLIAEVWHDTIVDESSLRVAMSALRRALSDGPGEQRYILNEHGRGYRFVATVGPATSAEPVEQTVGGDIPAPVVRLIGRSEELGSLADAFARTRLVTLVGPGGIGKSTLALAAAHHLSDQFRGCAHFIDLALIEDDQALSGHVGAVLGVPPGKGLSPRSIASTLPDQPLLLLLDNCEHLLAGVAQLVETLLSAAPQISILATSREPIRARQERVLRLPGMAVPKRDHVATAKEAMLYPAVELFVERAAAASDFSLTDVNADAAARLCRHLDGIPLAIEFAAGWTGLLPMDQIVAGLDNSLLTLSGGRRTALPRHQTLFAVLDWSYRALSLDERLALDMMSVFRGSFTLAAAKSVAATTEAATALDDIGASLVEKSLLTIDPAAVPARYRLLATTRSYAARKLADRQDHRDFLLRHALVCVAQLEGSNEDLLHLTRQDWTRKYGPLLADVRAALAWCFSPDGDPAVGVDLTSVASQLGLQSAIADDLRRYTKHAIDHLPNLPGNAERMTKLRFLQSLVDFDRTDVAAEGFEVLAQGKDDRDGQADTPELQAAGWGANFTVGNYPDALHYARKVLATGQRREQPELIFAAKRMMAQSLHHLGQHAEARRLSEEVLACPFQFLPLTATSHAVSMRINLARIAFMTGETANGLALALEATELGLENTPTAYCQALTHALIPLQVWTGDVDGALRAVESLRKSSSRHGMQFWIDWTETLTLAVEVLRPGGSRHAERIDFALSRRRVPVIAADFLTTFLPPLKVAPTALRVVDGTVLWCAPEVIRAQALASDDPETRMQLLQMARQMAIEQGATAWAARAEHSIASTGEIRNVDQTIKGSSFQLL